MASYSVFKSRFKKSILDSVYQEVTSGTGIYHHFFGRENTWVDELGPFIPSNTTDEPLPPENNLKYELSVRRDILTTKKILPSDISYVVNRFDWVSGSVYDMYDDAYSDSNPAYSGATSLEDSRCNFYVLTPQYNVYKCIWNNNNAASTQMPTGNSPDVFSTSDGYKWKFMYPIPVSLRNRFLTNTLMPVSNSLKAKFYSTGEITNITINNPGEGYHSGTTTAAITGDGYKEANPYIITDITPVINGSGYLSTPDVTISDPFIADDWLSAGTTAIGSYIKYLGNFYLVLSGVTLGVTGPTHTSGTATNGDCSLKYVGTTATATANLVGTAVATIDIDDPGYGYSELPTVTLDAAPVGGTTATAIAVIEKTDAEITVDVGPGGDIIGFTIVDPGIGYTNCNIIVTDSHGTPGSGAILLADFGVGTVNTIQANIEALAVPGTIDAIKVVDGGANYSSAIVTIIGDGTGATATAILSNGKISQIQITNPGSGYTWTDVQITGNVGSIQATARAIMSPAGGHGSDCINELNAKALVFYTSLSRDFNQGFEVNNDYRKVGLIKNITEFDSYRRSTEQFGSGCMLIEGLFDRSKIQADMLIYNQQDAYKRYRVVDFNDTQILLSAFNNFPILNDDVLVTDPTDPATPSIEIIVSNIVKERTIDQFSGDMLMFTVTEPFNPTAEQIITARTILEI